MIDPRLSDFIGADERGMALSCVHCFDLVTSDRESTEDGTAHLDCAIAAGAFDSHVCAKCGSYSAHETDAQRRCAGCAEIAEEEALAKLGLVRLVSERVSRSAVCSSRQWVPTDDGLAVAAARDAIARRAA